MHYYKLVRLCVHMYAPNDCIVHETHSCATSEGKMYIYY